MWLFYLRLNHLYFTWVIFTAFCFFQFSSNVIFLVTYGWWVSQHAPFGQSCTGPVLHTGKGVERKMDGGGLNSRENRWRTLQRCTGWIGLVVAHYTLYTPLSIDSLGIDPLISHGFTGSLVPIISYRSHQHLGKLAVISHSYTPPSPSLNHTYGLQLNYSSTVSTVPSY